VLMRNGLVDDARSEVAALSAPAGDTSDAACMLLFTKGRTAYKKNQLGDAIAAFGDIGERCPEASDDWGARGLYLKGMAQFRRKQYADADRSFSAIPRLYPQSTLADDGWLHAGISLQEVGKLAEARARWTRSLEELPEGDMTPEATWRLAWSWYLDGDPAKATAIADRLGQLSLHGDRRHVESGRYWAARWRLYPDVAAPSRPTSNAADKAEAIARWVRLCEDLPHSYYSILAFSRLAEVAPDRAAALRRRPEGHTRADDAPRWTVRRAFYEDRGVRAGIDLARLGLLRDARAAWDRAGVRAELPDEAAWLFELQFTAGDWLRTHDAMRGWLEHNPPGTLGDRQPWVLRVGYPDRYWDLVQVAASGYRYEPRLFHALVREESNFNRTIRSHAGAIGLSQLMPYTAKETAGWMKVPVGDLDDPANNLKLGARYLDSVIGGAGGSPYLALAGYNAGPGRVKQWLGEWGNIPTDEYVERIPFRETRGYVRRVMTTWQTYRFQFDEGDAFPDLSKFNHRAKPE
jgi:soluble lytic murein transglycosylase